ncbi:MAG: exodeoxyribonuclease VII small subunit [Clostridiales bacterium]|nr:exodeoxyribonuclease VII small subunit [Clostridiales bacterium]
MDEREKKNNIAATDADSGQDQEENLSLEASFERLDGVLERLEDREIPLEEAFTLYQQGLELLRRCNEKIDTVEKKILIMNGDGGFDEF